MRSYFAILKDSFREALVSRVLWIVLLLATLFLLALVPLSVEEQQISTLRREDITHGREFLNTLKTQSAAEKSSPSAHIWKLLSEDLRDRLRKLSDDDSGTVIADTLGALRRELNDLLEDRDFYDEAAWKGIPRSDEARKLLADGIDKVSDEQLPRLNRLLLNDAYPTFIRPASESEVYVAYFGYMVGDTLPFSARQATRYINETLVVLMGFFVGTVGVFIGVLVTASMIPHTFEPGAIDLLLSKPIARPLLFLTKFAGGCAFVLLNTAYFIFGLWLIVGWRFDIWNSRLLMCIPVFLFLFAIYYSVSALAGVIWRNAVVSVVVAILFWAACFTVGQAKNIIETVFLDRTRLMTLVPAGDSIIGVTLLTQVVEWNNENSEWEPIFQRSDNGRGGFPIPYPMLGPVYDSEHDRLTGVESVTVGRWMPGLEGQLVVGSRSDDWRRIRSVAAPEDSTNLFLDPQNRIIIGGVGGIFEFQGDPTVEYKPFNIVGLDLNRFVKNRDRGSFVEVGPEEKTAWKQPFAAAMDAKTGDIAVFQQGELSVLHRDADSRYAVQRTLDLETDEPALMGFGGDQIVIALGSGEIRVAARFLDGDLQSFQPFGDNEPRQIATSRDGRFVSVLSHDRQLWIYDTQSAAPWPEVRRVTGRGDVSAVAFGKDDHLFVVDRFDRVTEYSTNPVSRVRAVEPSGDILKWVYLYFVEPLYTVFPKPGELDSLIRYLITDERSFTRRGLEFDLGAQRDVFNVWDPIISCTAFLIVILTITCVYISRRDF